MRSAKALEEIVRDGLARGLLFLSDRDARPAGAAHPVGDDGSAAGRELNRRVEVSLVPLRDLEAETHQGELS